MFGIGKGMKFDRQVKKQYGAEMIKILHKLYDNGIKDGIIPSHLKYYQAAPIMLAEMAKDAEDHKYMDTRTGKPLTGDAETQVDGMVEMIKLERENPREFQIMVTISDMLSEYDHQDVIEGILKQLMNDDQETLTLQYLKWNLMEGTLARLNEIEGANPKTQLDLVALRYLQAGCRKVLSYKYNYNV